MTMVSGFHRDGASSPKKGRNWIQYLITVVIAVAAFIAGGMFLDRILPEAVTEEDTERTDPEGTYLLYHTEDLEEFLADPQVRTIVIPEGVHTLLSSVELHKELVVESGACLEIGYLDVGEDGHVQVDGTLNACNTMIRMQGERTCITVASTGTFLQNENTVIWAETDENLAVAVGAVYSGAAEGKNIALDVEQVFGQAQSVQSQGELIEALKSKKPMRLDADIHLTENVVFDCPVYIREGVTLSMDADLRLEINTELFVNYGCIDGGVLIADGKFFLNYGTVTGGEDSAKVLSVGSRAVFLNMGTVECGGSADALENASLYNIGTIQAYQFYLMGGTCFNYGTVNAKAGGEAFTITNAGRLYNYGYFVAEQDSIVKNDGWVENDGYFTIENGAAFENNVFYNRSQFECGFTSTLNEWSGIYYGNGEFRINGISSVAVWKTADLEFETASCEVTTEEELAEALTDNEVAEIVVNAAIRLQEDLEITKPVFLRASLSAEDAVSCLVKNTYLVLEEGGQLEAKTLQLDNSLLVVDEGKVDLADAVLELNNRSALCVNAGEIGINGCSVSATRKSVLSMPYGPKTVLADVKIRLEDSRIMLNGDMQMERAVLALTKASNLNIYSGNLTLERCELSLEEGSTMEAEYGNLVFSDETRVTNSGQIRVEGRSENEMLLKGVTLINYGAIDIAVRGSADEQCTIENEGEMNIPWLSE